MNISSTTVTYRGDKVEFSTQKEAYIWLVKKFFNDYPQLLQDESIIQGHSVRYFSHSPEGLSPRIAEKAHYYTGIILSSGTWFVNVKLTNQLKIDIISKLSKKAGLVEGTDWSWDNASARSKKDDR